MEQFYSCKHDATEDCTTNFYSTKNKIAVRN